MSPKAIRVAIAAVYFFGTLDPNPLIDEISDPS